MACWRAIGFSVDRMRRSRSLRPLQRLIFVPACLLLGGTVTPCKAGTDLSHAEPSKEECLSAVERARALAATLPADHLSRIFAESHLHQAMIEANNGEFDECLEWAERATEEVKELRHTLQPGETLKILRPDDEPGR